MPSRFDNTLMQPPAPGAAVDDGLLRQLRAWLEAGLFPRLTAPFGAASIAPLAGLDGVANELDGSHALVRMGRGLGLAWRLWILLREQVPGRKPQPEDPWDCGWWREGPLSAAAAFRPRRATLLLLREPAPAVCNALLATLRAQSPAYARPLRVLVVSAQPVPGLLRL